MKRVIVLSDTHGLLRPEVLEYLSQADVIIHGGDINSCRHDRGGRARASGKSDHPS